MWSCKTEIFLQYTKCFLKSPPISKNYSWSDSASPDGSDALRLPFSIWRYVEIKTFDCYTMKVIALLLMMEKSGIYHIIFHIFWFTQQKTILSLFFYLRESARRRARVLYNSVNKAATMTWLYQGNSSPNTCNPFSTMKQDLGINNFEDDRED
jgi:hypothetical protein